MQVKWVKTVPDAQIPSYAHEGDAGFDLAAADRVVVYPFQKKIVPTGLKVELPKGFELQIRPRSGVSLKKPISIANAPGTIDSNYRGEVGIIVHHIPFVTRWQAWAVILWVAMLIIAAVAIADPARNIIGILTGGIIIWLMLKVSAIPYIVEKGDRVAQGVICALPEVEHAVIAEDALSETTRGSGGFGSTGIVK
ncbi:MAG: dUTP diphosphatase [Dissulfurispiraceae bacterium]|jgi:dUTP pyrophosphatase